jgi:hypothetical protein
LDVAAIVPICPNNKLVLLNDFSLPVADLFAQDQDGDRHVFFYNVVACFSMLHK